MPRPCRRKAAPGPLRTAAAGGTSSGQRPSHTEGVAAFHDGEDAPPLRRRKAAPGPLRTAAAGATSSGQRPSHTEGVAAFHDGEDAPPLRRRKAVPGPLRTAPACIAPKLLPTARPPSPAGEGGPWAASGRRKPPSSAGGLLPCAFGGHPGTIGLFRVGHGEGGSIALKGSCCRKRIPSLSAAWAEALTSAWQTADGRAGLRGLRTRGLSGQADGGPADPLLPVPRQGSLRRYEAHPKADHGHEPLSGPAEMLRFAALDPAVLAAP